jgi:type VI protein secretion system component VasK
VAATRIKIPSNAATQPEAPLASAFGPLLRVAGSDLATAGPAKAAAAQPANTSDISLPRYLERVTGVRLKLQQIMMSPDPDAMSRTAAQAILQGKTSDIGDSRDYASRVAASLGEQWSGFGNAVFQRPLDQTWDVVLQPATASLNETWRHGHCRRLEQIVRRPLSVCGLGQRRIVARNGPLPARGRRRDLAIRIDATRRHHRATGRPMGGHASHRTQHAQS